MKTICQQKQVSLNVQSVIPFKTRCAKRQLQVATTRHSVIRSISSPTAPALLGILWLECQPELCHPSAQGKTIAPRSSDSSGCLEKHLKPSLQFLRLQPLLYLPCQKIPISHINHPGPFLIPLRRAEITRLFRRAHVWTAEQDLLQGARRGSGG